MTNSGINSATLCSLVPNNFLNNISVIRSLGRGTYGNVFLVENADGNRYAVKYMKIESGQYVGVPQSVLLDIDALVRLKNVTDIIRIIGVCYQNTRIALILEPMDSDLRKFIPTLNLNERLILLPRLLLTMIRSAALFETLNITHFDIKSDNVLVRGQGVSAIFKVTDFGLARASFGSNLAPTNELYTIWYRPPEFLCDRDRTTFRIYSGDIWAIVITVIEFITGRPVFPGNNVNNMIALIFCVSQSIGSDMTTFIESNHNGTITGRISARQLIQLYVPEYEIYRIDPAILEIMSRMLSLNPNDRPTAIQILDAFGERINPNFLATLIPIAYPRRVYAPSIDLILRLCNDLELSKASMLVAIEIFTRYIDTLDEDITQDPQINTRVLAVVLIAGNFIETKYPYTYEVKDSYRRIMNIDPNNQDPITNIQIAEMEKQILHAINFEIYNISLTSIIQRAYTKNIDLRSINPNEFAEPLDRWLI